MQKNPSSQKTMLAVNNYTVLIVVKGVLERNLQKNLVDLGPIHVTLNMHSQHFIC